MSDTRLVHRNWCIWTTCKGRHGSICLPILQALFTWSIPAH